MKASKLSVLFFGIFLLSTPSLLAQNEVSQREVIALLELKAKTKGHLWINKWDQNKPISTWHGVTVKNGKVVGLDLSNNNLQGRIPITIGNLRHLEYLNLSDNNIKGKIPSLFRKFQNLMFVDLANNDLTGNIPLTINKLHNLHELNLSNNKLGGELPQSITELSKLHTLALSNNELIGTIPVGMEKLKKLKNLYLANNQFNGSMNSLRSLGKQQLVYTDFKIKNGNLVSFDISKNADGISKLKFED